MTGRGVGGVCQSCLLMRPKDGHRDNPVPSEEQVAAALPRFKIHERVGRGALGAVYRSTDTSLERTVAIKTLLAQTNPEHSLRFLREASTMARLNHPHIVSVYDFGTVGELDYLVMEWMPAGALASELARKGKLPPARAIDIASQVCEALRYAHANGVVHRDVKPGNILLDSDGAAKLSDFGLVKSFSGRGDSERTALTRTDMAVGTPLYMAPEQKLGLPKIDQRADIYSLGMVIYEMLSGERYDSRQSPPSFHGRVPSHLEAIIARCLHEKPSKRYASAAQLGEELRLLHKCKERASKPAVSIATLTALALIAGAAAWTVGQWWPGDERRRQMASGVKQWTSGGLPLASFEEEIDLSAWQRTADYTFADDVSEADGAYKQMSLTLSGNAVAKDGMLHLYNVKDRAEVEIQRDSDQPLLGLALHLRFKVEEYLSIGRPNRAFITLQHAPNHGIFLQRGKVGDQRPTFLLEKFEPVAPAGIIEPLLDTGQWHEVWLVLGDGCRLWIDDKPVYRSRAKLGQWGGWEPDEPALLWVEGFRGEVDYLQVWERWFK